MNLGQLFIYVLELLGIGKKQLIADGAQTVGKVTKVDKCWWMKVNKKAVRIGTLDGAVFPHIITYSYVTEGEEYTGKCFVHWDKHCPEVNEPIHVYYDRYNPQRSAVNV